VSAYGPFELAPLEAVVVPERPAPGSAPSLDAVREQAFEEGFAAGVAQAQSQLDGPASAPRRRRRSASGPAHLTPPPPWRPTPVDLALRIAEQAVGAAITADPELVVEAVRGALRRLVERDRVLILVNPDDLELVRDHVARLVGELGGIEHCEVQAERRVRPGGAIVRTSEGEVDATLETKLARAREVLEHELANG
jgi:flagellar assembly protein FliH